MSNPTERDIRREIDELRSAGSDAVPGATVEWGPAEPAERPDGMSWGVSSPSSEDAEGAEGDGLPTLRYDLWGAQRDVLDRLQEGEDDVVAFLAGYGTGKSVLGARWTVAQALQHPGSKFLAMGVSFQEARDTTYTKLFSALPGPRTTHITGDFNGPETSPIVADYNRQEHRITLVNDSVIVLGSADRYSRFAGAEFGGIWLDEPSHYGETLHDLLGMLTTRLRSVAGPKTQLWTLTGEGYNAAWEILEKRHDANGEPLGLDIEVVRGSVLNNPYLADGDKERFKRQYEGTTKEQQALHGGFAAATGLVYSNFSRETHVIPHSEAVERVEDDWRIYGYDAGWNDPRVLLEVGKTPYDQLIVLDEFHQSGSHVEDAIEWLDADHRPEGTIYCEHVPDEIEKMKRAGLRPEKAAKSVDAGIAEVRKRLDPDGNMSIDEGRGSKAFLVSYEPRTGRTLGGTDHTPTVHDGDDEKLMAEADDGGRVGLLVSEHCPHLIREFLGYKEEHVQTSQAVDHCLDALRYLCMGGSDDSGGGARVFKTDPW